MTDILARVPKPIMVMRSLRVPAALWERAKTLADKRDENISDVIRRALEQYVTTPNNKAAPTADEGNEGESDDEESA